MTTENPTQWAAEINHPDYGRFVWIDDEGEKFGVYSGKNCNTKLAECKISCKCEEMGCDIYILNGGDI